MRKVIGSAGLELSKVSSTACLTVCGYYVFRCRRLDGDETLSYFGSSETGITMRSDGPKRRTGTYAVPTDYLRVWHVLATRNASEKQQSVTYNRKNFQRHQQFSVAARVTKLHHTTLLYYVPFIKVTPEL